MHRGTCSTRAAGSLDYGFYHLAQIQLMICCCFTFVKDVNRDIMNISWVLACISSIVLKNSEIIYLKLKLQNMATTVGDNTRFYQPYTGLTVSRFFNMFTLKKCVHLCNECAKKLLSSSPNIVTTMIETIGWRIFLVD